MTLQNLGQVVSSHISKIPACEIKWKKVTFAYLVICICLSVLNTDTDAHADTLEHTAANGNTKTGF